MITNIFKGLITNSITKLILYYFLVTIGLILFLFFLWVRFIRERLPRNIPFTLTEYSFLILVMICCIYIFIIIRVIFPKAPNFVVSKMIEMISKPYVYFDTFLKYNKYVYNLYFKLFCKVCDRIEFWTNKEYLLALYIVQLIPRIILLLIFITDIFYFHSINLFYYFIIIGLVPLIYTYTLYSLNLALEAYIQQLESIYDKITIREIGNYFNEYTRITIAFNNKDPEEYLDDLKENNPETYRYLYGEHNPKAIYHDTDVSIREYLEIQFQVYDNYDPNDETTHYEYEGTPLNNMTSYKAYLKNNNKINGELTAEDYKNLNALFDILMPYLLVLNKILKKNKKIQEFLQIKVMQIGIIIMYFICWLYILVVSFHTLQDMPVILKIVDILTEYANIEEPFSHIKIKDEITKFINR